MSYMPEDKPLDPRWHTAMIGLPVLVFARRGEAPMMAEVTGMEGHYIWVVLDGEEDPRRLFWCDVRPTERPEGKR